MYEIDSELDYYIITQLNLEKELATEKMCEQMYNSPPQYNRY